MVRLQRQADADAAPGIIHGRCHGGELLRSVRRAPSVPIAALCKRHESQVTTEERKVSNLVDVSLQAELSFLL